MLLPRDGSITLIFYRTHLMWNWLPLSLREIIRPSIFMAKLIEYISNEYISKPFSDSGDSDDSASDNL